MLGRGAVSICRYRKRETESHDSIAKIVRLICSVDELHLDEKEESYEAAVMIEIAVRIEIDRIITRNLKDYAGVPLLVYSPAQLVKLLYAGELTDPIIKRCEFARLTANSHLFICNVRLSQLKKWFHNASRAFGGSYHAWQHLGYSWRISDCGAT